MSPRREKNILSDSGLRGKSGVTGKGRFYLRKRAVSEEAEQPETLTGDSLTDLRRDGREEEMTQESVGQGHGEIGKAV
jgi:hypothetical protein